MCHWAPARTETHGPVLAPCLTTTQCTHRLFLLLLAPQAPQRYHHNAWSDSIPQAAAFVQQSPVLILSHSCFLPAGVRASPRSAPHPAPTPARCPPAPSSPSSSPTCRQRPLRVWLPGWRAAALGLRGQRGLRPPWLCLGSCCMKPRCGLLFCT